ncbi:MAG TPA: PEGA domain-containing protein [Polyangia bacterium]
MVAVLLVATAGVAGARKPAAAAADPQMAEAKRHFDQAVALFNDGDFGGALAEFEASYKIHPSAGVLYNVGLTQKALYRYDEALASLRKYLVDAQKIPKDKRAEVTQLISEIQALLATVTFSVTPAGTSVVLDGRELGQAPTLGSYGVAAGMHTFDFAAEGYKPAKKELKVVAGQPLTLTVSLEKIPTTGKVRVTVKPPLAEVIVDDKPRGPAPVELELPLGGHTLAVQHAGYVSYQGELVVTAGQSREVPIELTRPILVKRGHWYEKWYFWVPVTAVVAGAVATGVGVSMSQPSPIVGTLPSGASRVQ